MTPRIAAFLALVPMILLLLAAVRQDFQSYRIPNAIVFWGAGLGLLLNAVMPEGFGFANLIPGGVGLLNAAAGLAIGLVVLLPMYLLRAMGAGDVKLMAMVGAFLGPDDVVGAILATFIAGGVLSIAYAWKIGVLRRTLQNIHFILYSNAVKLAGGCLPTLEDAPQTAAKFPYAAAIAVGTLGYVAWKTMWKNVW